MSMNCGLIVPVGVRGWVSWGGWGLVLTLVRDVIIAYPHVGQQGKRKAISARRRPYDG
jgi:hypothetical protein